MLCPSAARWPVFLAALTLGGGLLLTLPAGLAAADPPDLPPEATADVYDQTLAALQTGPDAAWVDMRGASLALHGQITHPLGTIHTTNPADEVRLVDADAAVLNGLGGAANLPEPLPLAPGEPFQGSGAATFATDGVLWVDGPDWDLVPLQPGRAPSEPQLALTLYDSANGLAYTHQPGAATAGTEIVVPGPLDLQARLAGTIATWHYDASTRLFDLYLIAGALRLETPTLAEFSGPDDQQTALRVRISLTGDITTESAPLVTALTGIPAQLYTLRLTIDMVQPIPADRAAAALYWYLLLDLDGDPATGFQPADSAPSMATGLGVDLRLDVSLEDDGSLKGRAFLLTHGTVDGAPTNMTVDTWEVPVRLLSGRTGFSLDLSLIALDWRLRHATNQITGEPFRLYFGPQTLRWRVAAVNQAGEHVPTDLYPTLDAAFLAPADALPGFEPPAPELLAPSPDPPTTTPPPGCSARTSDAANLRDGPGTRYAVVKSLPARTPVEVRGQTAAADWFQVALDDGTLAWIAAFLLEDFTCPDGVPLSAR